MPVTVSAIHREAVSAGPQMFQSSYMGFGEVTHLDVVPHPRAILCG